MLPAAPYLLFCLPVAPLPPWSLFNTFCPFLSWSLPLFFSCQNALLLSSLFLFFCHFAFCLTQSATKMNIFLCLQTLTLTQKLTFCQDRRVCLSDQSAPPAFFLAYTPNQLLPLVPCDAHKLLPSIILCVRHFCLSACLSFLTIHPVYHLRVYPSSWC